MAFLPLLLCCSLLHAAWLPCSSSTGLTGTFPGGDGWDWISAAVGDLNGAQFMSISYPLVQISANAYRYPGRLRDIPGWSLSSIIPPLAPPLGGVHALVFEENASVQAAASKSLISAPEHGGPPPRLIISFRGTQLSSSIDSLADQCADKLLWEDYQWSSLPAECLDFDPQTLDYFSQAVNYTLQVINLYPSASILLTGHSLGASLGILVAGALSATHTLPVIGFSAAGTRKALLDRGLLVTALEDAGRIVVIGHEWDVVMRQNMDRQVGFICLYPQSESTSCKACLHDQIGRLRPSSSDQEAKTASQCDRHCRSGSCAGCAFTQEDVCTECFTETHYLKNLIALVQQGEKPRCQKAVEIIKPPPSAQAYINHNLY